MQTEVEMKESELELAHSREFTRHLEMRLACMKEETQQLQIKVDAGTPARKAVLAGITTCVICCLLCIAPGVLHMISKTLQVELSVTWSWIIGEAVAVLAMVIANEFMKAQSQ